MGTTTLSTSLAGWPGLKVFGVTAAMTTAQFQLCTPQVLSDAWFRDPEAQNMQKIAFVMPFGIFVDH